MCYTSIRDMSSERKNTDDHKFRKDRMGALAVLAVRFGALEDERLLAREALQAAVSLGGIEAGALFLLPERGGRLALYESVNMHDGFFSEGGDGLWEDLVERQVLGDGVPVLISDVSQDCRIAGRGERFRSLAVIPLTTREKPVGILVGATFRPREVDPEDMEFLVALASQTGASLDNARLRRRLEMQNRALADQNAQLEDLLSTISHDLRTPLATIGGCASLLQARGKSLSEEDRERFAATILRKTMETSGRFEALLDFFRATWRDRSQMAEEVDVGRILAMALEEAAPPGVRGRFAIELPDRLPTLIGYPSLLTHAFTNLLSNAFKFTQGSSAPRIAVGHDRIEEDGRIVSRFTFTDNGMGIPKEYLPTIFVPFARGPVDSSIPGSGMGLAVVARIVKDSGGSIAVSSQEGVGTTFTITLPWAEA